MCECEWARRNLLRRNDADAAGLARSRLAADDDLDVLIERRQEVHQAFHGEACQLVVTERRNLGLRNSQHLGCICLREFPLFKYLIQRIGEAQLGLTLGCVWEPQVGEYVAATAGDRLSPFSVSACHSAPRNLSRRSSGARRQDRHPASQFGYRTATSSGTRGGRTRPFRIEPCTPLDTRFRHATPRSPAHRDRAPSTASLSAMFRRTARCQERCPCPL